MLFSNRLVKYFIILFTVAVMTYECIFKYDGSGFSETVYWNVEWLSENEIRLYLDSYNEEDYSIEIPDE